MKGIYQKLRQKMGWLLMILFMGIPWIPYGDRQAILLDIGQQQFNFFGTTLWPQDLTLLATLFMIAAFALFFCYHLSGPGLVRLLLPTNRMDLYLHLV